MDENGKVQWTVGRSWKCRLGICRLETAANAARTNANMRSRDQNRESASGAVFVVLATREQISLFPDAHSQWECDVKAKRNLVRRTWCSAFRLPAWTKRSNGRSRTYTCAPSRRYLHPMSFACHACMQKRLRILGHSQCISILRPSNTPHIERHATLILPIHPRRVSRQFTDLGRPTLLEARQEALGYCGRRSKNQLRRSSV